MKGRLTRDYRSVSILLLLLLAMTQKIPPSLGAAQVAKVALLRGEVRAKDKETEQIRKINQNDWVNEGDVLQTAPKSFAKLLFVDKTQINLGPDSKMVINHYPQKEAGLISLIQGKIRAQVTKDVLLKNQQTGEKEDKLYIKTKSAAMGIRGTDLQVVFNPENEVTSLVTFEDVVKMVQLFQDNNDSPPSNLDLRAALNSDLAVAVTEGQFSGANPQQEQVSLPVKINPTQFETLKGNTSLQESPAGGGGGEGQEGKKALQSPIPPGITARALMNEGQDLTRQLENNMGQDNLKEALEGGPPSKDKEGTPPPEGFFNAKTGAYAPPAGGFVDLKTALYVPPPPGSTFDSNTGVYVPPPTMGKVDLNTGQYVPPAGYKLESDGKFVVDTGPLPPRGPEEKGPGKKEEGKEGPKEGAGKGRDEKGPGKGREGGPFLPPPPPSVPMTGADFVPANLALIQGPVPGDVFRPPLPPPLPYNFNFIITDLEAYRDQQFQYFQQQQQYNNLAPTTNVSFIINVQ